jgi:branched-chain amino acid transport system substrate-binding protein
MKRRTVLAGMSAGLAAGLLPRLALAQGSGPIKLGSLTPLTGAGANYGGRMRDAIAAVVGAANAAGGVHGRELVLVSEDDQTSPEAGVRAARKLIDVDGVAAIMGVWASSVTTAVAPLCWESRTMLFCTSGADSITRLPHQGYVVRTEPGTVLLMGQVGRFMVEEGAKKLGWIGVQTPFAQDLANVLTAVGKQSGIETTTLIYEADKTSYRTEVDQMLATNPDFIFLGGYSPDTIVVLRDLFRAGYAGRAIAPNYTVDETVLAALPPEVTDGVFTEGAVTPETSPGLIAAKELLGVDTIDSYTVQAYDHANLAILALAAAATPNGEGIRDNVRVVGAGGEKVSTVADGLKAIAEGKDIDFDGASGLLEFDEIGDITTVDVRYDVVKDGAFALYKSP